MKLKRKKMTNILLISEDFVKTHSALSDNFFGKYLTPAIVEAQDMGLQTILGSCFYNYLLGLVGDESIKLPENAVYKGLIDDYIQPYLLYMVLSNASLYANVKLANIGTHLSNDEHVINLTQGEVDLLRTDFEYKAGFYQRRLQEYLLNNCQLFPQLDACACKQLKANLHSAENVGIWLGGAFSK